MSEELSGPLGSLAADSTSPEAEVRWRTAALLSEIPGDESEGLLVAMLRDADYRVRERAAAGLSRRLTPRVGVACLEALDDDGDAGRRAAAVTLLTAAGERGATYLYQALGHRSADVRLAGAMSLPPAGALRESVVPISEALRNEEDPNVRAALVLGLGRTRRREAVPEVLQALERGNVWMKIHALEALGEIGDPDTTGILVARTSDPSLRRGALRALARIRSARPAEDLARIAAADGLDPDLLHALRAALEAGAAQTASAVAAVWPSAFEALTGFLSRREGGAASTDAAHVLILLDFRGASLEVLRAGPFEDGFAAFLHLSRERLEEALHAVLQAEDPEPALVLVERAIALGERQGLLPLLVHPSPAVRAAVLNSLPPGAARLSELIDILAEEDAETVLPAALSLAAAGPDTPPDHVEAQKRALLDRAGGPDGLGRVASLLALADVEGDDVDSVLQGALTSPDPDVRTASLRAAAGRDRIPEETVTGCLRDPAPVVRAAALRTLARWAVTGRALRSIEWRDCLVFLADEGPVPPAAGAAIVALAGTERSRMAEELLAQGEAIRLAALEEIPRTGDSAAAEAVALATTHEDADTARAALLALTVARQGPAEAAAVMALADSRPSIRRAGAELVVARRDATPGPALVAALARTLAAERDGSCHEPLLRAVAVAGGEGSLAPLTELLANEWVPDVALETAVALAARFEEVARREWRTAPARAERRWAHALAVVGPPRGPAGHGRDA